MPFFKICQVIGFTLADSSRSKFKLNAFCNKSSQTYNISKIFFSCYLISNLDLFYSQILIDVFFFLSFFITFIAWLWYTCVRMRRIVLLFKKNA
jgi:hypothetical protein